MTQKEFKVSGVTCMHCVTKVENTIGKYQGVHNVVVSLEQQTVKIEADPMPTAENLNLVLEDVGDYKLIV